MHPDGKGSVLQNMGWEEGVVGFIKKYCPSPHETSVYVQAVYLQGEGEPVILM